MQKRYLLSSDLDESLLKKDKTISLRTRLYIRKFVRNGNIFTSVRHKFQPLLPNFDRQFKIGS